MTQPDSPKQEQPISPSSLASMFHEGSHLRLCGDVLDTGYIFDLAMRASLDMGGRPVACHDLLPELSMRVVAGPLPETDPIASGRYIDHAWIAVAEKLTARAGRIEAGECITVTSPQGVDVRLARTGSDMDLESCAMRVSVEYSSALVARFQVARHEMPLIGQDHRTAAQFAIAAQTRQAPGYAGAARIGDLIRNALLRTEDAADDRFARLPMPVRYRASGALEAWAGVRSAAGRTGAEFTQRLRDDPVSLMGSDFGTWLDWWSHGDPKLFRSSNDRGRAHSSIPWQMFDVCKGALFEPTPPLHRLLDDAYIADDVPVGLLAPPADTMCIVPDPSWWGRKGGVDAIMLFRRRAGSRPGYAASDVINVAMWSEVRDESWIETGFLAIPLEDPQKTISQFLSDLDRRDTHQSQAEVERSIQVWRRVLDYTIKMLLYLATGEAQVIHDRAYSDASRNLGGLGKRRRAERLAQIELLYDRHVVGPPVLDELRHEPSSGHDAHREVRGHWRRPHFKMQPHGPQRSLRKLVFIGPTVVRPDRLGL
ncbi:hypothetical protein [Burkholderia gladioli]|uniref:hypothetical protein n=1 Tax=Burkholderia gladioli TaxID=28095 RepID=UPI001FC8A070|nr:hypothetical protein [Burkholderia gladioli]